MMPGPAACAAGTPAPAARCSRRPGGPASPGHKSPVSRSAAIVRPGSRASRISSARSRGPPSRTSWPASSRTSSGPRMPIRTVYLPLPLSPFWCLHGWSRGTAVHAAGINARAGEFTRVWLKGTRLPPPRRPRTSSSPSAARRSPRPTGRCCWTRRACRPATTCPARTCGPTCCGATDLHTTCPFKGEASYWSAEVGGEVYTDLVWSYETPIPQAAQITGLMCFYPDRVELTVDGAGRCRQPGPAHRLTAGGLRAADPHVHAR